MRDSYISESSQNAFYVTNNTARDSLLAECIDKSSDCLISF
jgi:hypothetical protein